MPLWRDFSALNWRYVAELYDRYCRDAGSVDASTQAYFWERRPPLEAAIADRAGADAIVGAANFAHAMRASEPRSGSHDARRGRLGPHSLLVSRTCVVPHIPDRILGSPAVRDAPLIRRIEPGLSVHVETVHHPAWGKVDGDHPISAAVSLQPVDSRVPAVERPGDRDTAGRRLQTTGESKCDRQEEPCCKRYSLHPSSPTSAWRVSM